MQTKLSTSLEFSPPDESFSLDELTLRLKNLYESHAYCSVLHAFLDFLQRSLVAQAAGELAKENRPYQGRIV